MKTAPLSTLLPRTTPRPPRLSALLNPRQMAKLLDCPLRALPAEAEKADLRFIDTPDGPRFQLLPTERRLRAIVARDGTMVLLK